MVLQAWDLNSSSANHHHALAFESWVVTISARAHYVSHQDGLCLDWFKNFTASQPFQLPIICIMNGWRRWRLVHGLKNGHHNVFFSHGWGQSWLVPCPLFTPRLSEFGLIGAVHSISTLSMSHWMYSEWFCKLEIWIHHPQAITTHWLLSHGWGQSWLVPCPLFTSRLSEFGLIGAVHIISFLSMSHWMYSEWFCKLEIWIHHPQTITTPWLLSHGWWQFRLEPTTFHTKMDYVWIDSRISQHLNPSNFPSYV